VQVEEQAKPILLTASYSQSLTDACASFFGGGRWINKLHRRDERRDELISASSSYDDDDDGHVSQYHPRIPTAAAAADATVAVDNIQYYTTVTPKWDRSEINHDLF